MEFLSTFYAVGLIVLLITGVKEAVCIYIYYCTWTKYTLSLARVWRVFKKALYEVWDEQNEDPARCVVFLLHLFWWPAMITDMDNDFRKACERMHDIFLDGFYEPFIEEKES